MKFDFKSIFILLLLIISCVFIWKYYNQEDSNYKKELKRLRDENEMIQLKRDSLMIQRKNLESELLVIKKNNDSIINISNNLQVEILRQKNKADLSKKELDKLRRLLEETRLKIEELKKNPKNRDGNELLNSLKLKSKK